MLRKNNYDCPAIKRIYFTLALYHGSGKSWKKRNKERRSLRVWTRHEMASGDYMPVGTMNSE